MCIFHSSISFQVRYPHILLLVGGAQLMIVAVPCTPNDFLWLSQLILRQRHPAWLGSELSTLTNTKLSEGLEAEHSLVPQIICKGYLSKDWGFTHFQKYAFLYTFSKDWGFTHLSKDWGVKICLLLFYTFSKMIQGGYQKIKRYEKLSGNGWFRNRSVSN